VRPPGKLPYTSPIILWLVGFFILMAFVGRGKLSWWMAMVSLGYVLLLPAYLLAALFYNFFLRPRKYRMWERKLMCQKCGFIFNVQESAEASSNERG
jgi:hypothetical protein